MRGGTLLILGSGGGGGGGDKVNFGTLGIKPCGHDTEYSFSPIIFKLHI